MHAYISVGSPLGYPRMAQTPQAGLADAPSFHVLLLHVWVLHCGIARFDFALRVFVLGTVWIWYTWYFNRVMLT